MTESRQHPDLFTAEEAAAYIHRPGEVQLLESYREKKMIAGERVGREYMYHRLELDALVSTIFSHVFAASTDRRIKQPTTGPRLRMAGGSQI